ncbi:MAG: PhzF family phenazine biosynthesis protein [Candidatus Bipolaricaulia bacterium]
MTIPIYQVDAFTSEPFRGNPAGVCILKKPGDEAWMQAVATEMNLSETAFVSGRADGDFALRWFTPAVEVELCGHATLATAHILWETGILATSDRAHFHTKSGLLTAVRQDKLIELDFPADPPSPADAPDGLLEGLGLSSEYVGRTRSDFFVEVESEATVRNAAPDVRKLKALGVRGVLITAQGETAPYDFISRFFAPGAGIDEDPVTGSAHCGLAPYWGEKLSKTEMVGYQASRRGGIVRVQLAGDRVRLRGDAVTVLRGELTRV